MRAAGGHESDGGRGVRRAALSVAVFLVVGAAINVAVAWTCAALSEAPMAQTRRGLVRARAGVVELLWSSEGTPDPADPLLETLREAWRREGYGEAGLWLWSGQGPGLRTSAASGAVDPNALLLFHRCGWPCDAFACSAQVPMPGPGLVSLPGPPLSPTPEWRGALTLHDAIRAHTQPQQGPSGRYDRPLPCAVQWRGFLINSVVLGAGAWVLVATPGWARFGIRRWCRCCTACGYPIGVSDVCTECGRPVRAQDGSHGLPREEGVEPGRTGRADKPWHPADKTRRGDRGTRTWYPMGRLRHAADG